MLIDKPVNVLTYKLYKYSDIPHKNIRIMRYTICALYSELTKIVILLLFFGIIGKLYEFLFAFFVLMLIRPYSGGIHFNSFMGCLLFTLIFFILITAILPSYSYINNPSIYMALFPISSLIIYLYSPMPSKHRPITNKKIKKKFKCLATLFSVAIYIILLLININPTFKAIGLWTIILQATQLLVKGCIVNIYSIKEKLVVST